MTNIKMEIMETQIAPVGAFPSRFYVRHKASNRALPCRGIFTLIACIGAKPENINRIES